MEILIQEPDSHWEEFVPMPEEYAEGISSLFKNADKFGEMKSIPVQRQEHCLKLYESFGSFKEIPYNIVFFTECVREQSKIIYAPLFAEWQMDAYRRKGSPYIKNCYHFKQTILLESSISLGNILIRPETLIDKIEGFLEGNDIDFDNHKKFSKKYFTVSETKEDEELFRENISGTFLDTLAGYEGIHVEIYNHAMVLNSEGHFQLEAQLNLFSCAYELNLALS